MDIIRALFSSRRPIDRTIEKVIDYYAQDEDRLATEIEEYEITDDESLDHSRGPRDTSPSSDPHQQ
jgi:hypothetical protein